MRERKSEGESERVKERAKEWRKERKSEKEKMRERKSDRERERERVTERKWEREWEPVYVCIVSSINKYLNFSFQNLYWVRVKSGISLSVQSINHILYNQNAYDRPTNSYGLRIHRCLTPILKFDYHTYVS